MKLILFNDLKKRWMKYFFPEEEEEVKHSFIKYLDYDYFTSKKQEEALESTRSNWKVDFTFAETVFFMIIQLIFTHYLRNELTAQNIFLPLGRRIFKMYSSDDSENFLLSFAKSFSIRKELIQDVLLKSSEKMLSAQVNCGFTFFKIFSETTGLAKLSERESKKMLYTIELDANFFEVFEKEELVYLFTDPSCLPMVTPPLPWNILGQGGFYFNAEIGGDYLGRKIPFIKESPFLKGEFSSDLSKTFNLINNLQRTSYKIEVEYLNLLEKIIKDSSLGLTDYEIMKLSDVFILPSAIELMGSEAKKAASLFDQVKGAFIRVRKECLCVGFYRRI